LERLQKSLKPPYFTADLPVIWLQTSDWWHEWQIC
jgi:hypothetical protein